MKLTFDCIGSKGDIYTVTFHKSEGNVHCECTCKAGKHGQLCRHRIDILKGNPASITSDNKSSISDVIYAIKDTEIGKYLLQISQLETAIEVAQKELVFTKKKLSATLR